MSGYYDLQQICSQMKDMLPALNSIRDKHRSRYDIGRELSLAFTHLEDAVQRVENAKQWIAHGIQDGTVTDE